MQIYPIDQLLIQEGFAAIPPLRALNPNKDNYSALLFQPQADIEADTSGVRHADATLAAKQFTSFLEMAITDQADLAITPEYSMPWESLETAILNGTVPASGSLWVLGCESTTLDKLAAFKDRVKGVATVIYEPLTPQPNRFLNPVAYVFMATTAGTFATDRIVIVVQFKMSPMGDKEDYEKNHLQTGTRLYRFGSPPTQLGLATLICSDAFAITDNHALELYHRTLLIHIQLNKSPRQAQYRQYRDRFFQYRSGETEILCLNWAKGVRILCDGHNVPWTDMSGSAWYLCPDEFDNEDSTIKQNHEHGLYYTWLQDLRCHALFFAYSPAVYSVTASKVAYHGVIASQARRRGPILTSVTVWDSSTSQWMAFGPVDDGFSAIVGTCGSATKDITALALLNPLYAERSLALCAGAIPTNDWYTAKKLDSCSIDKSEIIRRLTACQDLHPDAQQFRTLRLRTVLRIVKALGRPLPAALADLSAGYKFDWSPQFPHANIVSTNPSGNNRRATVIYLNDQHTEESAKDIAAKAADHIGQWAKDNDQMVEGKQRIGVWFRDDHGEDVLLPNPFVDYDQPHTESPFDIGRGS